MSDINLIKKLREQTQVGMMDCKKALAEANGDYDKAVESLRKKGAAVAAKRADNATNNGNINMLIAPDYTSGTLVEVSCETDFSANTEDMRNFSGMVCSHILSKHDLDSATSTDEQVSTLMTETVADEKLSIQAKLDELIAKIAESIKVSRFVRFSSTKNIVNGYIHPGSKLGILVELEVDNRPADITALVQVAKDVCMQIAVSNPMCVRPDELDADVVAKERDVYADQLRAQGKPEQMIDNIVKGKLNKFYEGVCLLNQKFIKEEKNTIQQLLDHVGNESGCTVTVARFVRFSIGN